MGVTLKDGVTLTDKEFAFFGYIQNMCPRCNNRGWMWGCKLKKVPIFERLPETTEEGKAVNRVYCPSFSEWTYWDRFKMIRKGI